eukprot:TRINITY_DN19414_c0_g1_i1.p1 TRINITY_DN19414_c0_g1~~TRINITY_DN19414_c0_g1_i1.p1  ORF type:complete len:696 (-),score=53.14 TRINITY_DN19414_c0_g1_i1:166-2253(-)
MEALSLEIPHGSEVRQRIAVIGSRIPCLFGVRAATDKFIFQALVSVYVLFFIVHRLADVTYLLTVDAKPPPGLEHIYNSVDQRLNSLSYIRWKLACSLLRESVQFIFVLALVSLGYLYRINDQLNYCLSAMCRYSDSCMRCYRSLQALVCRCYFRVFARSDRWISLWDSCLSLGDLLHGALFVQLLTIACAILTAPFKVWLYHIDIAFGFANFNNLSICSFVFDLIVDAFKALFLETPKLVCYIFLLQFRFGWVIAHIFACMLMLSVIGDASNLIKGQQFPNGDFYVGHNFGLFRVESSPSMVSANRIFYQSEGDKGFSFTRDSRKNKVGLMSTNTSSEIYLLKSSRAGNITKLSKHSFLAKRIMNNPQVWVDRNRTILPGAWIESRSGKRLLDASWNLSVERNVSIKEIKVIHNSVRDARANAFIAGIGEHRVIGLSDTLFLGDSPGENEASSRSLWTRTDAETITNGAMFSVDESDVAENPSLLHSARTKALSDAQILAILGHEFGHAALDHVEERFEGSVAMSFVSFAILGWMIHSPLVADAFFLRWKMPGEAQVNPPVVIQGACMHLGMFIFQFIVGPPLKGTMRLIFNGMKRSQEYAADAYSASISDQNAINLQSALETLGVNSNMDPNVPYFYEFLNLGHPSFARRWAAIDTIKKKTNSDAAESPRGFAVRSTVDTQNEEHPRGDPVLT